MSENTSGRVALLIQYLGTKFHGWQRQPAHRTVQAEIEDAIASILQQSVILHGAGRTDAGVHAAAQVAHFDQASPIPPQRWATVLNGILAKDILIRGSAPVASTWHARFSAQWRRYRYTIYTAKQPNLFVAPLVWHYYQANLDEKLIDQALQPLIGKHELTAFHRAGSSRPHSWVDIHAAQCSRQGDLVSLEIQAQGFLYGMVRLLVGMLVEVGTGQRSLTNFREIWEEQQREAVKYAAPPQGLCLLRVGYREFPFPASLWFDTQPSFVFSDTHLSY
ncbi:tRNA pseudouridine(38-40) synthase TruA [Gloeocapsa sp. PCC 73106]|uniref:tRNA pseudouridine(38-40) synthase TruA n=1 Tax=Gloeocapsa sp. PCC 73106 TaxID=102232 RepID=UPI0002ACF7D4|nr:tRNA pseudouridine(38-40) synthase TruA [Gloeocapsa sp. PCC 73106]ELR98811.1 pseudouridylate synthase I [Gloeocapsa sp. PCC 73106]